MNKVIINRGVPGSGKSTLTQKLKEHSNSIKIHSTDELCMVDGIYQFDFNKMVERHEQNYQNFCKSIDEGINIIVCDNTNTRHKNYKMYVDYAKEMGYTVIAVRFIPDVVENHIKRNTHNVPMETIENMIKTLNNCSPSVGVDIEYIVDFKEFEQSIDETVSKIYSM